VVIFTPNATGACRLVGEAYPFRRGGRLVLTADNHNSVNGLREFARARGARVAYVPLTAPELRVSESDVLAALTRGRGRRRGLFAYPAQSNFSGVQHPLDWVHRAQEAGYDVLLDAAAYVPSNRLDLSAVRPEFVAMSWYKVCGYPTGVGALLVRRDALSRLRRPWFSGGTIWGVSVQGGWHRMLDDEGAFEDGTVNFLSIPDVTTGLDWVNAIGTDLIHRRVSLLTRWLLDNLSRLKHGNGAPLIRLYGPADMVRRGGTVSLNFLDPDGHVVDERAVARDAAAAGISLRAGCFCNPGAGEWALGLSRRDVRGPWWLALLGGGFLRRSMTTVDDYLAPIVRRLGRFADCVVAVGGQRSRAAGQDGRDEGADRRALLGARVGQQHQVDGAELGQPVAGAEGGELGGHQAGGHRRDADAGRDRADQAVDAAAEAGAAVRQAGAVQRAAHLRAGEARRRVDDEG
jgi:selenocysteine lyase/cysteine desulfurase